MRALQGDGGDLALSAEDPELRRWALRFLSHVCQPDRGLPQIGPRLARIVRDESEVAKTRAPGVQGASGQLAATTVAEDIRAVHARFPEDVDWGFVDQFLGGEEA